MGLITSVAADERVYPATQDEALAAARAVAGTLPRWKLVKDEGGVLAYEASTRLLKFVDDVTIEVAPEGTGSRLKVRSRSRVGLSDFGTNGRRIRAFLAALEERLRGKR